MKHLKKFETNLMAQYRKASKEIEVVATIDGKSKKVLYIAHVSTVLRISVDAENFTKD